MFNLLTFHLELNNNFYSNKNPDVVNLYVKLHRVLGIKLYKNFIKIF